MHNALPVLILKKHEERRLREGHVWIYSNEIDTQRCEFSELPAGSQVLVQDTHGKVLGSAYVNPHSLICARLISRDPIIPLDQSLITHRLNIALSLRERLFDKPYYRLVHGEGDGLPGLVVDRYGDVVVAQINTAGMQAQQQAIGNALDKVIKPQVIVVRKDSGMRELEGMETEPAVIMKGELPESLLLEENHTRFMIDALRGQKTGWFYDHRMNRARMQHYVKDQRVLDVFSYTGAWGVQALQAGAREVMCIDASSTAINQVHANAKLNGHDSRLATLEGDAFEALKGLRHEGEKFDVVIVDPPAFIKRKKDQKEGLAAYRRINQMAMQLVNKGGYLISGSCSFHLADEQLRGVLLKSGRHLDRGLQFIEQGGQGPDHPVHPAIPETRYLKAFFTRVLAT